MIDIGSKLYTGELSGKGTRPKCIIRRSDDILLFKAETVEEIKLEIISAVIASVLGLKKPTRYWYEKARGRDRFYLDPEQFLLMQLFDYVTLNTDQNRDNFGIEMCDNEFIGLYPVYDHDSCFKGKSTKESAKLYPISILMNFRISF